MDNIFVAIRDCNEESQTSTLVHILEGYLSRNQATLDEEKLRWLLQRNFTMSTLDISARFHSDDLWVVSAIPYLKRNSQSILHLRVHGHWRQKIYIDDDIIRSVSKQHQDVLVTLKLTGVHRVTTEGVKILASGFPRLSTIDFSGCQLIDDNALMSMSRHYFNLNKISVCGCQEITNIGLLSLMSTQITFVDVGDTSVTDDGILQFVRGCPNLSDLGSYSVSDELIFDLCSSISHHHPLSALMGDGNKAELTDYGLSILSTPLDGDDRLHSSMGRPHLSKIRIYSCLGITNFGLEKLGGRFIDRDTHYLGCRHLTHVTLSDCQSVTDIGILHLCQGCREIRILDLIFCDDISDDALASVCKYCRDLTAINLFGCGGIGSGDYNIFNDLARLPYLQYANLVGTYVFYYGVVSLLTALSNETHVRWTEEVLELILEAGRFPYENDRIAIGNAAPPFVTIKYHPFPRIYHA